MLMKILIALGAIVVVFAGVVTVAEAAASRPGGHRS